MISVLSLRLAGPLYEASVQSVSIIRQLLLLYVPVVLVAVCGESCSLCVMISHSHIPVIGDLYSLMCSAGLHSHLACPVHSTPTLRQPCAPALFLFTLLPVIFIWSSFFLSMMLSVSQLDYIVILWDIWNLHVSLIVCGSCPQSQTFALCSVSNNLSLFGPPAGSHMYILNLVTLCINIFISVT